MTNVKWDAKRALELADAVTDIQLDGIDKWNAVCASEDMLRAAVAEVERLTTQLGSQMTATYTQTLDADALRAERDRLAVENDKLRGDVAVCSRAMDVQVREIDRLRAENATLRAESQQQMDINAKQEGRTMVSLLEMATELRLARDAVEVVRHALELGYFDAGGSTHGWATSALAAYDAHVTRADEGEPPRTRSVHSCDIPGCVQCANPEEP